MDAVTRSEFRQRFHDGVDLRDPDVKSALATAAAGEHDFSVADANGDGLILGEAELDALFKQVDRSDHNGDPASFDIRGKARDLHSALLHGRLHPAGASADFQAALKRDPAEAASVLNGMSMDDMLETLDGLPPEARVDMGARARTLGLNAERLEYADHLLANRCLPGNPPGDLEATGQVASARYFLEKRSAAGAVVDGETRRVVRDIVGASEGAPDSVQTIDRGIVSYGRYQFTLSSGNLERVLRDYVRRCRDAEGQLPADSAAATIARFWDRVSKRQESLRDDPEFRVALISAGHDPRMIAAQDAAFDHKYLAPAKEAAKADGLDSPLALAIYADTAVQGGLAAVRDKTSKAWADRPPSATPASEKEYLALFLTKRATYLRGLADGKTGVTNEDRADADMLRAAAKVRVEGQLNGLLMSEDLDLRGGADGVIDFGRRKIPGIGQANVAKGTPSDGIRG